MKLLEKKPKTVSHYEDHLQEEEEVYNDDNAIITYFDEEEDNLNEKLSKKITISGKQLSVRDFLIKKIVNNFYDSSFYDLNDDKKLFKLSDTLTIDYLINNIYDNCKINIIDLIDTKNPD